MHHKQAHKIYSYKFGKELQYFGISPGRPHICHTGSQPLLDRHWGSSNSSLSFQSGNIIKHHSFNFHVIVQINNWNWRAPRQQSMRHLLMRRYWWVFSPQWGACGLVIWQERHGPLLRIWKGKGQGWFSFLRKTGRTCNGLYFLSRLGDFEPKLGQKLDLAIQKEALKHGDLLVGVFLPFYLSLSDNMWNVDRLLMEGVKSTLLTQDSKFHQR